MDRTLTTRFGVDTGVSIFTYRSLALWMLGYPQAALANTNHALKRARELGQAATLMFAVTVTSVAHICPCGNYAAANAQLDELCAVADEKSALFWKAYGMVHQGRLFALTRNASDAVDIRSPPELLHIGQRQQHFLCRCLYRIWLEPMRTSEISMTPGAALLKR